MNYSDRERERAQFVLLNQCLRKHYGVQLFEWIRDLHALNRYFLMLCLMSPNIIRVIWSNSANEVQRNCVDFLTMKSCECIIDQNIVFSNFVLDTQNKNVNSIFYGQPQLLQLQLYSYLSGRSKKILIYLDIVKI